MGLRRRGRRGRGQLARVRPRDRSGQPLERGTSALRVFFTSDVHLAGIFGGYPPFPSPTYGIHGVTAGNPRGVGYARWLDNGCI